MFFITEKSEETTFEHSQNAATKVWFILKLIKFNRIKLKLKDRKVTKRLW